MKEINQNSLDTAIALGDAVCEELGICCETRGDVIFQIYRKLEELNPKSAATEKPVMNESQSDQNANPVTKDQQS